MARSWIVENVWTCTSCQASNRGRDMSCQTCGARKAPDALEKLGDVDKPVTDPKMLREAKAGRNWVCEYCGGQERKLNGECKHCGGPRKSSSHSRPRRRIIDSAGDVVTLPPDPDPMPLPKAQVGNIRPDPLWKRRIGPFRGWHIGLVFASAGALVWFIVWLVTPKTIDAHVQEIGWTYTENIRERATFHDANWDRPGNKGFYAEPAFNVSCQSKYYGTENCNPHECNPHSVSYSCNCTTYECGCTTSCSSNGNGYSTCSERCSSCSRCDTCYRTEYDTCYDQCPVYRDWCSYDYYDWPVKQTKSTGGASHEEHWPGLQPADGQRLERVEHYNVTFLGEGDRYNYEPETLLDFRRFDVGERWHLKVGRFGHRVKTLTKVK